MSGITLFLKEYDNRDIVRNSYRISCPKNSTIKDVKTLFAHRTGASTRFNHVMYKNKILMNEQTLTQRGIRHMSTLEMKKSYRNLQLSVWCKFPSVKQEPIEQLLQLTDYASVIIKKLKGLKMLDDRKTYQIRYNGRLILLKKKLSNLGIFTGDTVYIELYKNAKDVPMPGPRQQNSKPKTASTSKSQPVPVKKDAPKPNSSERVATAMQKSKQLESTTPRPKTAATEIQQPVAVKEDVLKPNSNECVTADTQIAKQDEAQKDDEYCSSSASSESDTEERRVNQSQCIKAELEQRNETLRESSERAAPTYKAAVEYLKGEIIEAFVEALVNYMTEGEYEDDFSSDRGSDDEDKSVKSQESEASGWTQSTYEDESHLKSLESDHWEHESDQEISEEYESDFDIETSSAEEDVEVTEKNSTFMDSGVQDIDSRSISSEFTDRQSTADQRSDQGDEVPQDVRNYRLLEEENQKLKERLERMERVIAAYEEINAEHPKESDDHCWLRENYRKIAQRLDVDELSIYLYEKRVIKDYQLEHIQKCSTHREKSHYLLRLMTRASTANVRRMRRGLSVTDQQELADLPTSRMNHTM